MLANSIAVFASSEYRGLTLVLRLKVGLCAWACASRLLVERFFGMYAGASWLAEVGLSSVCVVSWLPSPIAIPEC